MIFCIKFFLFKVDDCFVFVFVCGDYEVNDIKVKNYFEVFVVELVISEEIKEVLKCVVGLVGLIGVSDLVEVVVDYVVKVIVNGVCGVNEEGYYYINVNECNFNVIYEDFCFI